MKIYEFSTTVTADGKLVIPEPYSKDIPAGDAVRVIILIQESVGPAASENPELAEGPTLADVVETIRQSTQNPHNIEPASGLLADHLANSPETPDPTFDVAAWNKQWDEIEAGILANDGDFKAIVGLKQENWR